MRTRTLTFDLATWFLFATHHLVMMIICTKLFLNPTMHDEVMGRTRFWNTHTRTGKTLYALLPFPGGGIKRVVVSYWRKYVHEVLVNCLGGLSLPRKSVEYRPSQHDLNSLPWQQHIFTFKSVRLCTYREYLQQSKTRRWPIRSDVS